MTCPRCGSRWLHEDETYDGRVYVVCDGGCGWAAQIGTAPPVDAGGRND